MSTAQQTGFAEASVQKLPSLACVGYVDEVGEGKLSESGNYVVQPIKVRANGPGRGVNLIFLYRPEWLSADFRPDTLEEEYGEEGAKMLTVYRKNINVKNGISTLKGLCGSDENFAELAGLLIGAEDKSIANVTQILRDFFSGIQGTEIGYVLKQRKEAVGEDDNGKKIYERANGYEASEWFFPVADKLKALRERAKRSKDGSFRVAFDEEEY